ncbi:MAG: tRNA 5-methoxyuridine(34)/uridine 5-oxyacetic acid(34) synthase CmoB [Chloroflexota bacterium]
MMATIDTQIGFTSTDYFAFDHARIDHNAIRSLRAERQASLFAPHMRKYAEAVQSVQDIRSNRFDFANDVIQIGHPNELPAEQHQQLYQSLQTFCPWKKGPFNFFGTLIDAEWRSDWKWQRILPYTQPLNGRIVADIGCHNGYFMLRMLEQSPTHVIGFEPVAKHFWNFQLIQNIAQQPNLTFELLGVEHMDLYPTFFDTIFCLGILYHHTDPVGLLRKMHAALAPKGEIVIDCQGIPGDMPVALTPQRRYARARAIWFLPTQSCLAHWMTRAGFTNVRCIFAEPLSTEEQRRTAWADIDSLADFLDPDDSTLTVEGYPAPWRYYMMASK